MRVIDKDQDGAEVLQLFTEMIDQRKFLILWQLVDGQRKIHPIYIDKVNVEADGLDVSSAKAEDFELDETIVYFFCKSDNLIFKSELKEYFGPQAKLHVPKEIKLLDQEDQAPLAELIDVFNEEKVFVEGKGRGNQSFDDSLVAGGGEANIQSDEFLKGTTAGTDHLSDKEVHKTSTENFDKYRSDATQTEKISTKWAVKSMSAADTALFEEELSYITLDEEDKMYEGMRAAPRAKPPEGKMVTAQEASGERAPGTYVLYDLSRGGLSFLVFSSDEFARGELVHILAFDTKKFDEPMIAEVKSVREADELGVQFKVGCQFVTEED